MKFILKKYELIHFSRKRRRNAQTKYIYLTLPNTLITLNTEIKKFKIWLNPKPMELVFTGRISRETSCMTRRRFSRVPFTLIVRMRNGGFSLAQPQGLWLRTIKGSRIRFRKKPSWRGRARGRHGLVQIIRSILFGPASTFSVRPATTHEREIQGGSESKRSSARTSLWTYWNL